MIFHDPAYLHGFVALCVLVTHCHGSYGKREDVIYQEKSYLTLYKSLVNVFGSLKYPSKHFCSYFRMVLSWSTGESAWRSRAGSMEGRDPGSPTDGKEIFSPVLVCFCYSHNLLC